VDASAAWSTQELAEFLGLVSSFESEDAAAAVAIERVTEALEAEVAAIVLDGRPTAVVGYPEGMAPAEELAAVASGASRELTVPGAGRCPATVVPLEHPPSGSLVVARSGGVPLSPEEMSVLRGMASAASMTMRVLHLLTTERGAREESQRRAAENARLLAALTERQAQVERLAEEQSALRRVATLVARAVDQETLLAAVAEEVGRVGSVEVVHIFRYDGESTELLAFWGTVPRLVQNGERLAIGGHNVTNVVLQTGLPARFADAAETTGDPDGWIRAYGLRSVIGCPIVVEGRLWGLVTGGTTRPEPLPPDAEQRISDFTELVATAISNAQARAELAASRARVVAASDETRRRIERDLHDGIQQRLVTLALGLRGAIDAVPPEAPELRRQLTRAGRGLREVIEEVREISHGLHPAILSEAGLGPALRSLARRSPVPVELAVRFTGRLPRPLEVATYYVVSEALTNTAKHARASVATVTLGVRASWLRIDVSDNGVGGADPARGSGLVGLTDRVEALGGRVVISSPSGFGTTMTIQLPIP
jgi:signal transduction histidine kinase